MKINNINKKEFLTIVPPLEEEPAIIITWVPINSVEVLEIYLGGPKYKPNEVDLAITRADFTVAVNDYKLKAAEIKIWREDDYWEDTVLHPAAKNNPLLLRQEKIAYSLNIDLSKEIANYYNRMSEQEVNDYLIIMQIGQGNNRMAEKEIDKIVNGARPYLLNENVKGITTHKHMTFKAY